MAIGDKYRGNYLGYTAKVIFEDEEGKLLEYISGLHIGFKSYTLNSHLESSFTLIKEPRKTEKRYAIVYECKDGTLVLEDYLYFDKITAEEIGRKYSVLKFHDILEVQYTEKL